jgi:hypothetical protein
MQALNKKVLGLSGVARSGKDTFAAILENILTSKGKTVRKIALADPLKSDCDAFLKTNLNISAFTQVPDEKILIRPMLVWYGDAQRRRTNGRYWVDLASKVIENSNFDYYIITDVRYGAYEKDELYWLKSEWNGKLCHIKKYNIMYDVSSGSSTKEYVAPANEHEKINDPRINAGAHYRIEWRDVGGMPTVELLNNKELKDHVEKFVLDQNI